MQVTLPAGQGRGARLQFTRLERPDRFVTPSLVSRRRGLQTWALMVSLCKRRKEIGVQIFVLTQISGQGFGTMTVNSGIVIPSPAATVALFTLKGERRLFPPPRPPPQAPDLTVRAQPEGPTCIH